MQTCVCAYRICLYAYMPICVYVCMHIRVYARMCVCVYARMRVCVRAYARMRGCVACMRVCACAHAHARTRMHTRVLTCTHVRRCTSICMCMSHVCQSMSNVYVIQAEGVPWRRIRSPEGPPYQGRWSPRGNATYHVVKHHAATVTGFQLFVAPASFSTKIFHPLAQSLVKILSSRGLQGTDVCLRVSNS